MNKKIVITAALGAFVGILACPLVFAQYDADMAEGGSPHAQCAIGGKKSMMGDGMDCGMTKKTVTATSDGGVVVMSGDQLYKYDKKLKFINQAQIPAGEGAMGMGMGMGMMGMGTDAGEGVMKTCPMMKADGSMMSSDTAAEGAAANAGASTSASADPADHPAHH